MRYIVVLFSVLLAPLISEAAVDVVAVETNSGVTFSFSGDLNLNDTTKAGSSLNPLGLLVKQALIVGPRSAFHGDDYLLHDFSGPSSIIAGAVVSDGGTGDILGLVFPAGLLKVPVGYDSREPLAGSMHFIGYTLESIGLNAGKYTWSWGQGDDADSITLFAIPEPSTAKLFMSCTIPVICRRRR